MNGVEILSSEIIYETTVSWLPFFITIGVCAVIGFIAGGQDRFGFDWTGGMCGILTGMLAGVLVGLAITGMTIRPTNEIAYTKYKITIDDSVSMNGFLDTYEILDQEGKIYTVKERE
jgi:hypothetical protein